MRWSPRLLGVAFCAALFLPHSLLANATNVHVSRFWHNHQPLYWPEWNRNGSQTQRGQYAWDSITLKPTQNYGGISPKQHPENNLTDIFGLDDRKSAYQHLLMTAVVRTGDAALVVAAEAAGDLDGTWSSQGVEMVDDSSQNDVPAGLRPQNCESPDGRRPQVCPLPGDPHTLSIDSDQKRPRHLRTGLFCLKLCL
jgi:hypothetical protein